jgi:hypothetical protein
MADHSSNEFGKRRPVTRPSSPPAKRSNHVALLVMGTLAVGGGAYALMPHENCEPSPGVAATATPGSTECRSSSSSGHGSGGGSSRSSSSSSSGHGGGDAASTVSRGGFGSFGHAFSFHGG